jgi:hypothetical protein
MFFFVISRKGFDDYLSVIEKLSAPLWISAGILSEFELDTFRSQDIDVTDFNYEIGLNENEAIDDAIGTIREYHTNEVIWVQR